jgi:hypothetical protein
MTLQENWAPAEVPENHWSKSAEWAAYKAEQKAEAKGGDGGTSLAPFQKVGTVTPGSRTKTTHELQMEACQVDWVAPENLVKELDTAQAIAEIQAQYNASIESIVEALGAQLSQTLDKVLDEQANPINWGLDDEGTL